MNLNDLRKRMELVDLLAILDECILETQDILTGLIRSQIESGKSGDNSLPPYKSDKYALLKQKKGSKAPFGVVDLKFSGDFLNALEVKFFSKNVLVRSTDSKAAAIHAKYGFEFYQLSDENLTYYTQEVIQPLMLKKIRNVLR